MKKIMLLFSLLVLCNANATGSDMKDYHLRPKIYIGENMFSKELFYYNNKMTGIRHLVSGYLDSEDGTDIGVFDQFGLYILDYHGNYKSEIAFGWRHGILEPDIIIKNKNCFQIIASGGRPVGILNQKGKPIWIYDNVLSYSLVAGDLNRDGEVEYYVASVGLLKLNGKGQKIWKTKQDTFYDIDIHIPSDNNKSSAVVTLNFDGKIQFHNYFGKMIREWRPSHEICFFQICHWLNRHLILTAYDNNIIFFDLDGKIVFQHKLTHCPAKITGIRGISTEFSDGKFYFTILVQFSSQTGLSMLCVFSPEKKLVYQELLKVTSGLLAVKHSSSEKEILLVGDGPGKVNRYHIRD